MIISLLVSILFLIIIILAVSIKIVKEYERGVKFTLGRYSGIMNPGLRFVIPVIQSWRNVDIRTKVVDIQKQDTITKDNISVAVNAVLYFKVSDPKIAVIQVRNFDYAVSQMAQTTMRDSIGEVTLDELLGQREEISKKIKKAVDKSTAQWGIQVESIEIKDIELPQDLVRVIGKQAEAEREKRAIIIKAEGELEAAKNLVKAAKELGTVQGGLHIRTLQTINNLGNEKSNTIIYAVPREILEFFKKNKSLLSQLV